MKNVTYFLAVKRIYKSVSARIWSLFLVVPFLTLISCGNGNGNGNGTNGDAEAIRTQISEYNAEIVELSSKVASLERELEQMGEKVQSRSRTPIRVENLAYRSFDSYVTVSADVEAVQEAMISPEANGQISSISVKKGQKVKKGQELARLNTSVLQNNLAELKTSLQLAETTYQRQKRLWEQEIGSEMQYLQAKNNYESMQNRLKSLESQIAMSVITAPFDGIIDNIFAKEGELAMPGSRIMQIINLDVVYVNAEVSESLLPAIDEDEKVILRFPSFPSYEEEVNIHRLGNVINPENRTFRLQLKINNRNEQLKPNMMANLSVKTFSADSAIVVSSIIIKQDTQGYYVYKAEENDEGDMVARKVYIERGHAGEGQTMILSGLQEGDLLIIDGHNQVVDGALVNLNSQNPA